MPKILTNNIVGWNEFTKLNYPSIYILRWIPFNAWYNSLVSGTKDADALRYLKKNPNNELYTVIKSLAKTPSKSNEARTFQYHLHELRQLLDKEDFPSVDERIQFGTVEMYPNSQNEDTSRKDGFGYKIKRVVSKDDPSRLPVKSVSVTIEDLRSSSTISFNLSNYDVDKLRLELRKRKIEKDKRIILEEMFKKVEPMITVDVTDTKKGHVKIGGSKFNKDLDALCAMTVDILYELRCKAVHGEISVKDTIEKIYEHAYFLLESILKKLI